MLNKYPVFKIERRNNLAVSVDQRLIAKLHEMNTRTGISMLMYVGMAVYDKLLADGFIQEGDFADEPSAAKSELVS